MFLIFTILVTGSLFSTVLASSSVIGTDIFTRNLTVTGTCTGCGGDQSFTSYSIIHNSSEPHMGSGIYISQLRVGNDGSFIFITNNSNVTSVLANGTVLFSGEPDGSSNDGFQQFGQSETGKYKFAFRTFPSPSVLVIQKDNAILQTLGINVNQFSGFSPNSLQDSAAAMSANGKYIVLIGPDNGNPNGYWRSIIFEGS